MRTAAPAQSPPNKARRRWRLGAVGATVVAVIATYGISTALHADAAETLLSQGKPATASSKNSRVWSPSPAQVVNIVR